MQAQSTQAQSGVQRSEQQGVGRAPGLRDPATWGLLLLALALLTLSWSHLEGYQLADSVEYMERAESYARGEAQDPAGALRSFGFSMLLAPFFWVADRFGAADARVVVWAVRAYQILFGLALVLVCARFGARVGGHSAGLAAGFLAAANPIFLQYGVSPVSGVAAALCVGLALERFLAPGSARSAALGGLLLGAGFLMAYQTILVAAPVLGLVALRERWRGRRLTLAALGGFSVAIAVQVVLDKLTWGQWGESLANYLVENVRGVLSRALYNLGFADAARWLYERASRLDGLVPQVAESSEVRQLQSPWYYVVELHRMVVAPALVLFALGVLRAVRRPSWRVWLPILVVVVNAIAMSQKGSKSFRLWLPLLPALTAICGLGVGWLVDAPARLRPARCALAAALLMASLVLGVRTLLDLNTRKYGAYWEAMELANREATPDAEAPLVAASAYHWAVFHRERPGVEVRKLPHHLDRWVSLGEEQRALCLERLGELDLFLTHRPILDQARDLFDAVNARFELIGACWDEETHPSLGAVLTFRARSEPGGRRLVELFPPEEPDAYRARLDLERPLLRPMDFTAKSPGSESFDLRLSLLGVGYDVLPGSGVGWITYHWTTPTGLPADYSVLDRLTSPDGAHAWQNNHRTGYGFRPAHEWQPGAVLRESYPVLPGEHPFTGAFQPLGGPYRRGDLIPVTLWMTVVEFDEEGNYRSSLRPTADGAPKPLDMSRPTALPGGLRQSAEGYVESPDKLVRLTGLLIPVLERYRWPDDGRPDPP